MDEWNTWLDLDNEVFWWEWRKSKLESDEWIASLIWTMKFLLSTKKITLGFMDEWNTWFGLDNEGLDDANVGTHGWMKYLAWFEQWSLDDDDDGDEKYVKLHGWMNTRLVLQAWFGQWSLSRMKKSMLGVIDEWNIWLDLDNEVFDEDEKKTFGGFMD